MVNINEQVITANVTDKSTTAKNQLNEAATGKTSIEVLCMEFTDISES